jgi:malate dehydrogenase (oxaloacetate-decarboxylating)
MADKPIVFAMANPTPEIMPEDAAPYVAVMATGRSDYPNQINNVLCFPGIFRGALACRALRINEEMKLAAAHAIAGIITDAELHPEYIVPSVSINELRRLWRATLKRLRTRLASPVAEVTRNRPQINADRR